MYQNDVSDIPDLTFSMDADEEKLILYEKNEVSERIILVFLVSVNGKLTSKACENLNAIIWFFIVR